MGEIPPSKIIALSKQQLGLASDLAVPGFYKNELEYHLILYPDDDNFLVELEPGYGYGKVICLEQGCNEVSIPLIRRIKVRDGGLKDGCGSLSLYRVHISEHPTHTQSRNARLKAAMTQKEHTMTSNRTSVRSTTLHTVVKQEPSSSIILDTLNSLTSITESPRGNQNSQFSESPSSSPAAKRVSSLVRINARDKYDRIFSRKRTPDAAFSITNAISSTPTSSSSLKRFKTEPNLEEPLSSALKTRFNLAKSMASIELVEDTRSKLQEVSTSISNIQQSIDSINRKSNKTQRDLNRRRVYTNTLEVLKKKREEYNSTLPSMSSMKRLLGVTLGAQTPPTSTATTSRAYSHVKREEAPTSSTGVFPHSMEANCPSQSSSKEEVKPKPLPFIASKVPSFPQGHHHHSNNDDDGFGGDYDRGRPVDGVDLAFAANILGRIGINIPPPLPNAENFDHDGDFFGRGKDMFMGPQAKADDIDRFLLEAGNAEAFDGNAKVDEALEKLGLQNQYELLPGMEVALMPHQTIGVAWMVNKENGSFKGGCLADDMGLGKTVQMIALMLKNRSEDPLCKTTLIIAPTALLDQWKLELEMKTNTGLKCLIYHGQSKPTKKSEILKYDVVLTTYMTMSLEWPDHETEMKKKQKARKNKNDDFIVSDSENEVENRNPKKRGVRKERGLLFKVNFYRIVLDEAQSIRNRRTRTSRAVTELQSTYRWCLTGTPIINSLGDAYGYIRFLKIRPWYDFTEFQGHVGILEKRNPGLAVSRLQTILNSFLIRRKKDTELDGKRLIDLPEKKINLVKLEFSTEERDIYNMVETRTQEKFNRFLRAGTVLKNYHQVLVLLLRLRQICSHPCLIQEGGAAFIAPDEVLENDAKSAEVATELSRARRLVSVEFVTKMQSKLKEAVLKCMRDEKESADATVEDEECPICFDNFNSPIVTPCSHIFCRTCLVDHIHNAPPIDPTPGAIRYKADERACPLCASPVSENRIFSRAAFEPTDEELTSKKPSKSTVISDNDSDIEIIDVDGPDFEFTGRKPAKSITTNNNDSDIEIIDVDAFPSPDKKRKGKAPARPTRNARRRVIVIDDTSSDDEDDDMSDFIVQSDEDEEEKDICRAFKNRLSSKRRNNIVLDSDDDFDNTAEEEEVLFGRKKKMLDSKEAIKTMPRFLPSTKMKFMMEKLNELFQEKPDEKVLIISQWTACLSLVSDYLSENGIVHVKYQGDMNRVKRNNAVRVFMSKDQAKVMLMSLKCGGVGLNLTRANNVISLDLGWSQAVEAQAFDRVHRLGQQRVVNVKRLVISDTVEDRVLSLQERKQTLADGSLGEGTGKKIGKLTVRELASLFGLDHRGRRLDP